MIGIFAGLFRFLEGIPAFIAGFLDAIADGFGYIFRAVPKGLNKIRFALHKTTKSVLNNPKIGRAALPPSKPRTIIYFANCRLCSARFEDSEAGEARRFRAEHMQRMHGIYDKETVSDIAAAPKRIPRSTYVQSVR